MHALMEIISYESLASTRSSHLLVNIILLFWGEVSGERLVGWTVAMSGSLIFHEPVFSGLLRTDSD